MYSTASGVSEPSLRDMIETVRAFADFRLKEQANILGNVKAGSDLNVYLLEELDEQTESFMSSEYMSLLQSVISLSDERAFNINMQYEASEACSRLFAYSVAILFGKLDDVRSIFDSSVVARYVHRYNQETLELTAGLGSAVFAVRETCLKCLLYLVEESADQGEGNSSQKEYMFTTILLFHFKITTATCFCT